MCRLLLLLLLQSICYHLVNAPTPITAPCTTAATAAAGRGRWTGHYCVLFTIATAATAVLLLLLLASMASLYAGIAVAERALLLLLLLEEGTLSVLLLLPYTIR